jgi:hypothetical protein
MPTTQNSPLLPGSPAGQGCRMRRSSAPVRRRDSRQERYGRIRSGADARRRRATPHNFAHTPGGSSSGSGAAVGDFMVPLAFGTQTGGSHIRPASFNGNLRSQADVGCSFTREGAKLCSAMSGHGRPGMGGRWRISHWWRRLSGCAILPRRSPSPPTASRWRCARRLTGTKRNRPRREGSGYGSGADAEGRRSSRGARPSLGVRVALRSAN